MQQIILAAPPDCARRAALSGLPVAHMAYRIGSGGRLLRADPPLSLRGGLMVLDTAGFDGRGDPSLLAREVVRECSARRFDGILCDFDTPPSPFLEQAVRAFGALTRPRGWHLYVPEAYASLTDSTVLLSTALTGGCLEDRLREYTEHFGADRVALAVHRLAVEYPLPSGKEEGRVLDPGELAERIRRFSPAVYFDRSLCTHYFTYLDRGAARFVLFDDSGSILRKLELARELGITRMFLTFPEVEDILPRLLAE